MNYLLFYLHYTGVRKLSFLEMCSLQISSGDILPGVCTAVWVRNGCASGAHWGKAQNKGAFHILTFSAHCALGVSSTSRSFPLCRRRAEKAAGRHTWVYTDVSHRDRRAIPTFPLHWWSHSIRIWEPNSLGFKNELGSHPLSFHQLNEVKMQSKPNQVSFWKML